MRPPRSRPPGSRPTSLEAASLEAERTRAIAMRRHSEIPLPPRRPRPSSFPRRRGASSWKRRACGPKGRRASLLQQFLGVGRDLHEVVKTLLGREVDARGTIGHDLGAGGDLRQRMSLADLQTVVLENHLTKLDRSCPGEVRCRAKKTVRGCARTEGWIWTVRMQCR